jgi:hypothetical protein
MKIRGRWFFTYSMAESAPASPLLFQIITRPGYLIKPFGALRERNRNCSGAARKRRFEANGPALGVQLKL